MNIETPSVQIVEQEIKRLYNIDVKNVVFLGRSDNVTFRVDTLSGKYLLKLHLGSNSKSMIESELMWLTAINQDTNLKVQSPIKNVDGEFVTTFNVKGNHSFWTLQSWIEGELLQEQPTTQEIEELANLMVTLHEHSTNWSVPESFSRPIFNTEHLLISSEELSTLIQVDVLTSEHYKIFQKVTNKIIPIIDIQDINSNTWGMIHSDLHESNYVLDNGTAYAIDFSCCGFGFYLFDIAETFLHINPDNQNKFIHFYQKKRKLQRDYHEVLEAFFLWQIIRNFALLSKNHEEFEYLSKTIPFVVENFCIKYLDDVRFLLK
ncbi:aminoglycoside phosphotransferase [Salipaludibacillus neizhouensis]|uniref:Aminoglycoside phosphotransferase n=1 Tax=Salipaludibacillus neizhouensis TaxID=885475 RepID=A0A3A9KFN4_9BACI|nr:phosphotransferase [Salipaludibacillus neizhouensis]RKL68433.1 aminoglycoside phosphotransferase [Salipaludibacillus neizhouensis]